MRKQKYVDIKNNDKKESKVTQLSDFDINVTRRLVMEFYDKGGYQTAD